jgi:hypothetical protein
MRETREERKHRLSVKGSHAVTVRWDREHASGIVPVYDQTHAYGEYRITIESIRSGKVNVLYLREGERRDNFIAELNGEPWKPEKVSISSVTKFIRKGIVKTRSGRVI